MSITAESVIQYAKTLLAQSNDTVVGALPDGATQNVFTVNSDDQLVLWLNEGGDRLSKLCVPIEDTGSISGIGAGVQVVGPYTNVISSSGRRLSCPVSLSVNGNQLGQANVGYLNSPAANYWYPPTPEGDPTAWTDSTTNARVSPYTSNPTFLFGGYFKPIPAKWVYSDWGAATVAGNSLTCAGSAIGGPAPAVNDQVYLSGGSVTPGLYTIASVVSAAEVTLSTAPGNSSNVNVTSIIDPTFDSFAARTLSYYIAWMLAQKNMDVNVLMGRIAPCGTELVAAIKEIYARLLQTDPTMSAFFPAEPIDALVQIVFNKQVRA